MNEIWAAAEALAPDDNDAREHLFVDALTVVVGRQEPKLRAARERLFTSFVAAPTAWAAPRFAPHLQGAHRDGLWCWIVERSGAMDDADDIKHLATAARDLFEGADDAFRERVHEDAATLARAFIEGLEREPIVAATLLAWVPVGEQREMALRVVRAERGPLGIARSLLDELLTVQWQEHESAGIRDTVRALLVGCGKAALLPLADATTWGRAALVASADASTESYLWHRKLFAGSLDEPEQTLLAELTDVESFVQWLDGEGRAFAVPALSALSAGDAAAVRARRPQLFEEARPEKPPSIDRAAAMDHLRRLTANRSGVVGLVGSLAEAATPRDLEDMASILAPITRFSMGDSSAVWSAIAWRWQALGDFARAQEVASRSEFDQYRAELRFQLALASSQDDHLLAALGEVARLPSDPAISLFSDVEQCVREGRIGPVHEMAPCLELSTRVVVRSLLLASEAGLRAPPGLPRPQLEAELRAELTPLLARAEAPRHACLSYAALALPSEVPALWDLAWSADARYEDNAIGFPASAARLAWRWRGAEGLDALVTIALAVG